LLVLLQMIIGAVVSGTVTFWLQGLLLPQASVACQVRVASNVVPQCPVVLVTVLTMVIVLLPLLSVAVGASNVQDVPSSTVLLVLPHVITGAVVSTTVTFWLHCAKLPQASVACQVRVASKVVPQSPVVLVTVLTMVIVLLPLLSVAVGASNVQDVPSSTVLLVLPHVITGAVVSTTVTFWLHCAKLPQASVACQVRVASKVVPQSPVVLVTVLTMVIVLLPLLSVAVGASNVQDVPSSTVLLVLPHVITGAVVSTTVTFWLHCAKLPQASVACQVRVASKVVPQSPVVLVTVLTIVIVLLPLLSVAVGASNVQAVPSSTVLLVLLHVITGAVVSTTVTFWLHCAQLPQASVACHVRVASKVVPQCPALFVTVLTIGIVLLAVLSVAVGPSNVQEVL